MPIRIKNTFNPSFEGTVISGDMPAGRTMIKGSSSIHEVALLSLQGRGMMGMVGASMRLFGTLARNGVNVILISQDSSEYSICIAVVPISGGRARMALDLEFRYEMSVGLNEAVGGSVERSVGQEGGGPWGLCG